VTGVQTCALPISYAKVIFSKVAIIGEHDGKRTLMFRMANARATAIVEATARVYLSRDEVLVGGERMRRVYDLPLRRATSPIFNMTWLATHTIDEASPLYGMTAENLAKINFNLVVTFQGTDDRLAATVHTRYNYNAEDIVFDRRFVDIIKNDPDGKRYIDFAPFHDTEPLTSSGGRAAAG